MPKRARPLVKADDEAGCSDADDDEYCSEEDEANSLEDFIVADDESETGDCGSAVDDDEEAEKPATKQVLE